MSKPFEEVILGKLDSVLRLLAASVTRDMRQAEQIVFLDRLGFAPREIASLLGTTRNTVNVTLAIARRQTRKGEKPSAQRGKGGGKHDGRQEKHAR